MHLLHTCLLYSIQWMVTLFARVQNGLKGVVFHESRYSVNEDIMAFHYVQDTVNEE